MKKIPLQTVGLFALVDDADYPRLSKFKWYAQKTKKYFYVVRMELMHRSIIRAPIDKVVDHKNGNGLDNRRKNLRIATVSQNGANRKKQAGCSSKYKGVCWAKTPKKWTATISVKNKTKFLGHFAVEKAAAHAYDAAALELFGEFANLNFP